MPAKLTFILLTLGTLSNAFSAFTLNVNYVDIDAGSGFNDSGISESQKDIFEAAADTWEGFITGYQPGAALAGITINASGPAIDGAFNILGQAGPTNGSTYGGFLFATAGQMEFDSADLTRLENDSTLANVILHEMGHVLGIGTLWSASAATGGGVVGAQELYTNGTGQYTGANALLRYQQEYDPLAGFIPVELDGGGGTANGHWNERADNFKTENQAGPDGDPGDGIPAPLVNIDPFSPNFGESLDDEILTGVLSGSAYISNITLGSFEDLGYTVNYLPSGAVAVPEPSTALLLAFGPLLTAIRRRR